MKIYEIEVMAIGSYWAIDKRDLSGCSDIRVDCWQEAIFVVAARNVREAVKLIYQEYESLNRNYTNTCDSIWYNPIPVSVDMDDDEKSEIISYKFREPRDGDGIADAPHRYSVELK